MSSALAIFAKAPLAGQVKTRLCPPLTLEQAAKLYECFLVDTVARACSLADVNVFLAITPADSEPVFHSVLSLPVHYLPQRGATLGEREANVFIDLAHQRFSRILIIGSDIPTMPTSHLQEAFTLLEDPHNDVVIGPSRDGGYYLLGAKMLHPGLFTDICWSTAIVFQQTLDKAREANLSIAQVPPWYDVDSAEELQQLIDELAWPGNESQAPRTKRCLIRLGLIPEHL